MPDYCKHGATKTELHRCPKCGLTGQEIASRRSLYRMAVSDLRQKNDLDALRWLLKYAR